MRHQLLPDARVYQVANASHENAQTVRLDGLEQVMLAVLRYVFAEFSGGRTLVGQRALHAASHVVAPAHAADLLGSMHRLIRALGDARTTQFLYIAAEDANADHFLTPEEKHFLGLLHFARGSDTAAMHTQLLMLCEGGDSTRVLAEMRAAVELIFSEDGAQNAA